MILALVLACGHGPTPPTPERPTIAERLGDWGFLTPIDAPSTLALVAGGTVPTTAATCGGCHVDHFAEWSQSTHAHATRDLQYTAELAKPGQPRWLCLNCHAPTQPQRAEQITPDTRFLAADRIDRLAAPANPDFDAARLAEGVTCATCHVRRDADGQGTVVGPRGSGRSPHRVRVDAAALTATCVGCHSPGPAQISPSFVCWFETADEVARSPTPAATCTGCHMPTTERAAAVGAPNVPLRRHLWQGAGVPKEASGYAWLQTTGWSPGFDVRVTRDPLTVTLTNTRAAHLVPTADPERFVRVEARLEAADGTILARDTLRIGQTWDWGDDATGRVAHRLTDNRLASGEARLWTPTLPGAGARVVVEVANVRLTPDNARSMTTATLDAELRALHPDAAEQLPTIDQRYPLGTVVFREVIPTDGSPTTTTPLADLLAESAALVAAPLEADAARFAVP